MDTRAVVEHRLDALQRADLEATLDDYTDESLLLVAGSEPVRGREALAAVFGPAIVAMFAPSHRCSRSTRSSSTASTRSSPGT